MQILFTVKQLLDDYKKYNSGDYITLPIDAVNDDDVSLKTLLSDILLSQTESSMCELTQDVIEAFIDRVQENITDDEYVLAAESNMTVVALDKLINQMNKALREKLMIDLGLDLDDVVVTDVIWLGGCNMLMSMELKHG